MRAAFIHWAFTNVNPIGEGIITYETARALSKFISIDIFYQCGRIVQENELKNIRRMHNFNWFDRKYSLPFVLYSLTKLKFSKSFNIIHQFQYIKTLLSLLNIPYVVTCFLPFRQYKKS